MFMRKGFFSRHPLLHWTGVLSVSVGSCLLAVPRAVLAAEKQAFISGYDELALPGGPVTLRAKLERRSRLLIRPDVRGETLRFFLGERLIGKGVTSNDGIASVQFTPPGNGYHRITVKLAQGSKYKADDFTLLAAVLPADTKFIVTDIDHTIADISSVQFVLRDNKRIPVVKDSVEVLGRLSKRYHVVYVTARDDLFIVKTKQWLALRKFPEGPAFFWDVLGEGLSHRRFKTSLIRRIKQTHPNVIAGMGDLPGDAHAYIDNGLRAFIIAGDPGEDDDDLPEKAETVAGWKEIEKELLK